MPMSLPIPISDDIKRRFAREYLKTRNASSAALAVIDDPGTALMAARSLPTDELVIAETAKLVDEKGEESFQRSKVEIAREIYDRAQRAIDDASYERLMKLYCDVRGMIEKPGANVNVGVTVAPVMIVKDHGTDDEWAAKAAEQQRTLVLNAAQ